MAVGTTIPVQGCLDGEFEFEQQTAATDFLTLTGATSMTGDFLVGRRPVSGIQYEKFYIAKDGNARFGADTTNGVSTASGTTMVYGYAKQLTTALTGDLIGVRGNARVVVASASGSAYGGYFQAGSGSSATGADAVNLGACYGLLGEAVVASATATVTLAVGVKGQLDVNAATTAITSACVAAFHYQTGESSGTHTNSAGVVIVNENVEGAGKEIGAGLAIGQISRAVGFTYLIDLAPTFPMGGAGTVSACAGHTGDIRFSNGLVLYCPDSAVTANSTTTSLPAGSLCKTSNATGRASLFVSDGSKWQFLTNS